MVLVTATKTRLAPRCAHQFTRRAIERAALYLEHGLVELREGGESGSETVYAMVRGSRPRPYVVAVALGELAETGSVATACTCPQAADGALCKHVFAVLLAIDHREAPLPPGARVELPRGPALTVDPIVLVPFDPALLEAKDLAWFGPEAEPMRTEARPARVIAEGARIDLHGARAETKKPAPRGRRSTASLTQEPLPIDGEPTRTDVTGIDAHASAMRTKSAGRRDIPDWQVRLFAVRRAAIALPTPKTSPLAAEEPPRRIHFVIDVDMSLERGGLVIGLFEDREGHGAKKRPRPVAVTVEDIERVTDANDRAALKLLSATPLDGGARPSIHGQRRRTMHESLVPESLYELVLPALAATGRLECQGRPVTFDAGEPWTFGLTIRPDDGVRKNSDHEWLIGGALHRGDERVELDEPLLLLADGLVLFPGRLARLDAKPDFPWIVLLRSTPGIKFPERAMPDVLAELAAMYEIPPVELDASGTAPWRVAASAPRPKLILGATTARTKWVEARLVFRYAGAAFTWGTPASGELDRTTRRLVLRDRRAEHACLERLVSFGVRRRAGSEADVLELPAERAAELRAALEAEGWDTEAR